MGGRTAYPVGVSVVPSLVCCVVFYTSLVVLFLLAIVLSVILLFMASDGPFDIFKLYFVDHVVFCPLSFNILYYYITTGKC